MTVEREPDTIDLAVLALAERVMDVCDPSSFSLCHVWNGSAGMWFVEIEPSGPGPASITLYHGGDTLNICLGPTWFEYYPFDLDDLPAIEGVVGAARDAKFEQAGSEILGQTFARIYAPDQMWRVGHVHVWPWAWRRKKRYEPYPRAVGVAPRSTEPSTSP